MFQNKLKILEAKELATRIHLGQKDLTGEDYIFHLERVFLNTYKIIQNYKNINETIKNHEIDLLVSAWLHDIYEDHSDKISLEYINENFSLLSSNLVKILSKNTISGNKIARDGNLFSELECVYYKRISQFSISNKNIFLVVKMADLLDNMNYHRFKKTKEQLTEKQLLRLSKYYIVYSLLKELISGSKKEIDLSEIEIKDNNIVFNNDKRTELNFNQIVNLIDLELTLFNL